MAAALRPLLGCKLERKKKKKKPQAQIPTHDNINIHKREPSISTCSALTDSPVLQQSISPQGKLALTPAQFLFHTEGVLSAFKFSFCLP